MKKLISFYFRSRKSYTEIETSSQEAASKPDNLSRSTGIEDRLASLNISTRYVSHVSPEYKSLFSSRAHTDERDASHKTLPGFRDVKEEVLADATIEKSTDEKELVAENSLTPKEDIKHSRDLNSYRYTENAMTSKIDVKEEVLADITRSIDKPPDSNRLSDIVE